MVSYEGNAETRVNYWVSLEKLTFYSERDHYTIYPLKKVKLKVADIPMDSGCTISMASGDYTQRVKESDASVEVFPLKRPLRVASAKKDDSGGKGGLFAVAVVHLHCYRFHQNQV